MFLPLVIMSTNDGYPTRMSQVSNGVTVIGGGGQLPDQLVDASSVRTYVGDDEHVKFVLVGDGELVRETDDWKTTEAPGPNEGVVVVVTDRRVVFVVGACLDPDVDGDDVRRVHHADVDDVGFTDSLLSTTFTVRDADGVEFSLTPAATDGLEDLCRFVTRASMRWEPAREFFDGLDDSLDELETAVASGDTAEARRQRKSVYERLSDVGKTSSLNAVDLPALDADRGDAKRRIADAFSRGYWRRARDLTETGDERREADGVLEAAAAYRDACEAAEKLVAEGGPAERAFDGDALAAALGPFSIVDALAERLAKTRRDLADADLDARLAGCERVLAGYDHLQAAVADGGDRLEVDPADLQGQFGEQRQRIAEALERCVTTATERGEAADDDESARAQYQTALDALDQRERLAERHDDVPMPESIDAKRAELEDEIERTQWEWVGDG